MSWISITEAEVQTRLTGPELTALKQSALASGQTNPLPEIVEQVIDEIRGYIAAAGNVLGDGQTIPQKLLGTALAMIRYRLCTRLPVASLLTQQRIEENSAALRLLERVSDGKFLVEEPSTESTEDISNPTPSVTAKTENFDSTDQNGV